MAPLNPSMPSSPLPPTRSSSTPYNLSRYRTNSSETVGAQSVEPCEQVILPSFGNRRALFGRPIWPPLRRCHRRRAPGRRLGRQQPSVTRFRAGASELAVQLQRAPLAFSGGHCEQFLAQGRHQEDAPLWALECPDEFGVGACPCALQIDGRLGPMGVSDGEHLIGQGQVLQHLGRDLTSCGRSAQLRNRSHGWQDQVGVGRQVVGVHHPTLPYGYWDERIAGAGQTGTASRPGAKRTIIFAVAKSNKTRDPCPRR